MAVGSLDDLVADRQEVAGSLKYDGEAGPLDRLAITNTLLSLVTFGVYRFWGKVRLRRYLWSRISLAGDRLAYVGRAKERLLGFCLAVWVLAAVVVAGVIAEILLDDRALALAVARVLLVVLVLWLFHVAVFRARKHRLSRTKWRGIRAGQTGSATGYGFRVLGWIMLSLLTLFLIYPWARTALQRYRVEHSWFGNQRFSFEGSGNELFAPWLLVWLPLTFAPAILFIADWQSHWIAALAPIFVLVGVTMLLPYRVAEFRHFVSCLRFARCRFSSTLSSESVCKILLASAVLIVLAVAIVTAGLALLGRLAGFDISGQIDAVVEDPVRGLTIVGPQGGPIIMLLAWTVLVVAVLGFVRTVVYLHMMTRLVCASLSITEIDDFAAVAREGLTSGLCLDRKGVRSLTSVPPRHPVSEGSVSGSAPDVSSAASHQQHDSAAADQPLPDRMRIRALAEAHSQRLKEASVAGPPDEAHVRMDLASVQNKNEIESLRTEMPLARFQEFVADYTDELSALTGQLERQTAQALDHMETAQDAASRAGCLAVAVIIFMTLMIVLMILEEML